ncbi:hypothetical protein GCM10022224_042130 [Nonomuraea antimicrobica]|uniref:Oxidoreductase N-terminal domain-containing protein n=1 Tax=Nonomuraea antimicrobica TaxID=561173 RepID=A0ABP7BYA7_9ACTN
MCEEQFEIVETEVAAPGEGQFPVRDDWMMLSVVMSALMEAEPHPDLPMSAYALGEPPWMPTVGTDVASNSPQLLVGDLVHHNSGFREYVVGEADSWEFTRLDPDLLPGPQYHLNQGVTAWRGMVDVAKIGEGDTVFVSAARRAVRSRAAGGGAQRPLRSAATCPARTPPST